MVRKHNIMNKLCFYGKGNIIMIYIYYIKEKQLKKIIYV